MFLSIITTHRPATDLGFLLMKHPDRVHETDLPFGKSVVFYPEATEDRCEAVLSLVIDPIALVRGRGEGNGLLGQYVNDRPYSANSFLSVALNKTLRTAMTGVSKERPELAAMPIALEVHICPLPAQGGLALIRSLFEPLGWTVTADRIVEGGRASRFWSVRMSGIQRVADALSHLYVLIPVLDDDKHYWVGADEVDKLLSKGGAWLAGHPEKDLIALRYLKHRRSLSREALARLAPEEAYDAIPATGASAETPERSLEAPFRLNDVRLDAVTEALAAAGATRVADLGCGEGNLLVRLVRDRRFQHLIGIDASVRSLERASDRLKIGEPGGPSDDRVKLLHGALTYRDERWHDVHAAALVEVIEHFDPDRLPALASIVFGMARPKIVVVTTPNAEYNCLFPNLAAGALRHPDHRFEWSRAEFRAWSGGICDAYGYKAVHSDIGAVHDVHGAPTQMALFTR
jgi:3' terminal RNA ribose 2'-O-methyltransferase Hen1